MIRFQSYLQNKEYLKLFKNVINFFLFQLTNYLVPFLTIPYLVRVIGPEKFGIIAFAQSLILFFYMFIDYGFNITGTQKVAQNRNDFQETQIIFSTILLIRIFIMFISLIILLSLIYLIDDLRKDALVYILSFGFIPANILISIWFFTGMEEMQYLNYSNVIYRIGYLITIFIFVKNQSDFYWIPGLNSLFMLIAGIMSFIFIKRHFGIKLKIVSVSRIKVFLYEGFHIFISNFAINIYRNANTFILGLVGTKEMVGFYSAGEKIIKVFQSIFEPITQSLYPYISRQRTISSQKAKWVIMLILKLLGCVTAVFSFILMMISSEFTKIILGSEFIRSAPVIKICSFVIFFGTLNYIIGIIFMINFNLKKQFFFSVLLTGISNMLICIVLSYFYSEIGTAISFLIAEIFLFFVLCLQIYRKRSLWINQNE